MVVTGDQPGGASTLSAPMVSSPVAPRRELVAPVEVGSPTKGPGRAHRVPVFR